MGYVESQFISVAMAMSKDILLVCALVQACRVALLAIFEDEHIAVALVATVLEVGESIAIE